MEATQVQKDAIKIGNLIKWCSYIAMSITAIGLGKYLFEAQGSVDYSSFSENYIFTPSVFWENLCSLKADAIMLAGILLLMLAPLVRIILFTFSYAKNKNSLYTGIGILIVIILALSAYLGKGH